MIVYFDTNIFDHLEQLNGVTAWDLFRIRRAVNHGCVRLILSYLSIEETLFIVSSQPQRAEARVKLILELADKHLLTRGHHQIINDDIRTYAEGFSAQSHFESLTPWIESEIWRLVAPVGRDVRELSSVVNETRRIKKEYQVFMTKGRKKLKPKADSIGASRYPFERYWKNNYGWLVEGLAKRARVLVKAKRRGIDGLLRLKSVALAVGANLSLLYSQHFENQTPRPGDSRDILHAIAASGADIFVTNDRKLETVLARIPVDGFRVMNLRAFLNWLPKWV